ncbi:MAG: hypothetical protein R6W93_00135 [Candidatus Limnocylindrales bacterium]
MEAGRIEMAGSGVAISIPEGWTVEVASPDPDVIAAPPASAWEALRTSPRDGSVACSVYVGVPPAGHPLDLEGFPTDSSVTISWPRWEEGPVGPQLVTPRPAIPSGEPFQRGHGTVLMRLPSSHPSLPDGAQYALECWWPDEDGDEGQSDRPDDTVAMFDSLTLLNLG